MRFIKKRQPPENFVTWKSQNQTGPSAVNFNYKTHHTKIRELLLLALEREQGFLCAYTGISLGKEEMSLKSHIEHLKPQKYCELGEDLDFQNMVACYPEPNAPKLEFGAHFKDDWPNLSERHLFFSPLDRYVEDHFEFNFKGEIRPRNQSDYKAQITIEKLGLNNKRLVDMRYQVIRGTLGSTRKLKRDEAKKILHKLEEDERQLSQGQNLHLRSFCFVLKKVLKRHLQSFPII